MFVGSYIYFLLFVMQFWSASLGHRVPPLMAVHIKPILSLPLAEVEVKKVLSDCSTSHVDDPTNYCLEHGLAIAACFFFSVPYLMIIFYNGI